MEQNDPKVKELLAVARRLEGMTRHASVHAAGVVIAPKAITEYAPLYKGARDEIVTQWTMKDIERMGLLKMDFLGLSTLTLIDDAVKEIKRTEGLDLDIDNLPARRREDVQGVRGRSDLRRLPVRELAACAIILRQRQAVSRFDDLIALNALYRPGPLKSGMVDDWVERKQGKREVVYELPELESILADSYGVIAYQEHVLRIAQAVAGFTLGQADVLRKAMGKKDPKVMAKQREAFLSGATEEGTSEKKAGKLFEQIEHFAGYGFNKAHATAYALLAYRTAYLKANYPWHFAAALFTIEAQNADKLAMYLGECRDRGIPVLPPDMNESQLRFTVEAGEGGALRPHGDQERRRRRHRVAARGARQAGTDHVAARALRGSRPAPRQQARLREPGEGRGVRRARRRRPALRGALAARVRPKLVAELDLACEHGARTQARPRRRAGAACSAASTPATRQRRCSARTSVSAAAAVDRGGAAGLREGNARPLLERSSGRSVRRKS